jgi:probable rRNA maturation factor
MIHIQVDESFWSSVKNADLRKAARMAASLGGLPDNANFTIVITHDQQVRKLNREFRKLDKTTDVLSFPSTEEDPDSGKRYHGDIIISYPRAAHQAAAAGHSSMDELCLLVVHGTLHLAGYDHAGVDEQSVMFTLQRDILNRLGINIKGFST